MKLIQKSMKNMWVNCSVLVCSRLLSLSTEYLNQLFFEWELFSFSLLTASPIVKTVFRSIDFLLRVKLIICFTLLAFALSSQPVSHQFSCEIAVIIPEIESNCNRTWFRGVLKIPRSLVGHTHSQKGHAPRSLNVKDALCKVFSIQN